MPRPWRASDCSARRRASCLPWSQPTPSTTPGSSPPACRPKRSSWCASPGAATRTSTSWQGPWGRSCGSYGALGGRPVGDGSCLPHRLHRLLWRHEDRGRKGLERPRGRDGNGGGRHTHVVRHLGHQKDVVIAKGEIERLQLAAHLLDDGTYRLAPVLGGLDHCCPGLGRVGNAEQGAWH